MKNITTTNMEPTKNGYIAMYKGKKIEVYAETSYKAQLEASILFKAKKTREVTVYLCESNGKDVLQSTQF